ncbi:electron transfer flavoprotein subunit beta/FixA family protein [Euzebya rosea]|uniref:electron transfer flavoprotein subunit beta/FixA family protein n=1 Tax=Euzebya rosea TaxID=2052804 RepID=UPI00196B7B62|nr:electron transfer flavoprotein subunit beta/FixA family protein [Euzebya rosea]
MRIICPVKRVPDTAAEKKVTEDLTVDRDSVEAILNANDEWSIEEALRIKESRDDVEIVALCMGPDTAQQTVRKALSYGLDAAIQITDDAVAGSDAVATARVLAAALKDEEWDLIIMGNQSSDARSMLVPAMLAEFLDVPALTYAKRLAVGDDGSVEADRETAGGHETVQATLPAVVSVVEAINEPRYPNFKGIMAAKKKPLETKDLAAIGLSADDAGHAGSATKVLEATPKPPKEAGEKIEDDGTGQVGAKALVDFLVEKKFI